jgi:hypothetical protein
MSHLEYYNYEGYGKRAAKDIWYSQAVRVGDIIECSGQGATFLPLAPLSLVTNNHQVDGIVQQKQSLQMLLIKSNKLLRTWMSHSSLLAQRDGKTCSRLNHIMFH